MVDDLFTRTPRRKVQDLNIVPILDMLTTVIFFLLLSTSFLEYVKLSVPPASVSTVPPDRDPLPANPKLVLVGSGKSGMQLRLSWGGSAPGTRTSDVRPADGVSAKSEVQAKARELAAEFKKLNGAEKTLKIALSAQLPHQYLIAVMDGVKEFLPDVVLLSHADAEGGQ